MPSDIHDLCRQPIPVNLGHTDLKAHLESAVSSTYLHLNAGTCTSVRIGTTGMTATRLLENLRTALPEIIKCLAPTNRRRTEEDGGEEEGLWDNIQSLMIKTSESASLPIWSCQLGSGEGGRWEGLLAEQLETKADEDEHDGLPSISAKRKAVKPSLAEAPDTSKGKWRKRAAEEEESKEEPKRKKKKIPVGTTDEVISEMKGLAIEKAARAKGGKAKAEGKTAETNGSASGLIKIKASSSTSKPSKPARPTPESVSKPTKKKTGEEKAPGEVVLPSVPSTASTTKPPAEIRPDQTKADKAKKAKSKPAPFPVEVEEAPPPARHKPGKGKDEKPKVEKKEKEKEDAKKGEKEPKEFISTSKPPLKSAIKKTSSSPSDGVKEKKRISFDLRSGKEGSGKKRIGGKLSSKERLVGRGPRNA
jgi:ribosome biogenesis protein UTP30